MTEKKIRHTVNVRGPYPLQPPTDPPIVVEFFRSGESVEHRSYHYYESELLGLRIAQWVESGWLPTK